MPRDTIQYFTEQFTGRERREGTLQAFGSKALQDFKQRGIPGPRHEEWKYARVAQLFTDNLNFSPQDAAIRAADINPFRLPGNGSATELVFVDGRFEASLSNIRHPEDAVLVRTLADASEGIHGPWIAENLGHSDSYHPDGIHALNSAFAPEGIFIHVADKFRSDEPVYIYHVTDSRSGFPFAQPRILIHLGVAAEIQVAEHYINLGGQDSFTNEVIEIVAERDSVLDYYKIQNEGTRASHVGTTHIRQAGKCLTNSVTISLSGQMVRNNLNMIMAAEHGESHMYGLSLLNGNSLVDNHTIVDNMLPHCFSNELYKAMMDDSSTGVFNGKIFVRKDAQKTNAYQSNKNILLSDGASANTKPQLEILADDVKCSHGCTVGQLDEEALFYLRARGIGEKAAKALLLHAFAIDILEHIKHEGLREYVDHIISERLDFKF